MTKQITIIETPPFLREADNLFSVEQRESLIEHLSATPNDGAIIRGTGGMRKLRWQSGGKGKRGGARVIYYYFNKAHPVFLLAAYGKNEKSDLSSAERNALKAVSKRIIDGYAAGTKRNTR
ncbi:MAG: type II toxin-antitoxin system RelE/ParE family toxin [Rhodospirillaceae bacterium]|nr:type II toxin-antitoxin system RelE/ParE family toxin [Rhodospirillaceae bacterium]